MFLKIVKRWVSQLNINLVVNDALRIVILILNRKFLHQIHSLYKNKQIMYCRTNYYLKFCQFIWQLTNQLTSTVNANFDIFLLCKSVFFGNRNGHRVYFEKYTLQINRNISNQILNALNLIILRQFCCRHKCP